MLVVSFMPTDFVSDAAKNATEIDAINYFCEMEYEKELERARDAGEKGIDVKESGLETEVKNPKVKEEYGMGGLMQLNKLMVQTMKLYAAPKVEIDIFRGDPIEYSYFIESFRDVVEALVDNPKQRLIRLLKYTEGDAKDLIKHCVHEDAENCYDTAVSLLEKEYGNPFTIPCWRS